MTHEDRAELTARRLALRLDELGAALRSAGVAPDAATALVESAAVATMHAISLELLTAERARTIWHDAHVDAPPRLRLVA